MHHIAILCSDYQKSKNSYAHILGSEVMHENYGEERDSCKLDLALGGNYVIDLFFFPDPPKRVSRPKATGLRHIAFEVHDIEQATAFMLKNKIETEVIRTDVHTQKRFFFIFDADDLPIEFY